MKRPLHILHVNPELTSRGGERQCRLLIQAQLSQGHQPALFAARDASWWHPLQMLKVDITLLYGRGGFQPAGLLALRRRLLRGPVDILHLHSAHAHTLGRVASLGLTVPLVVHRRVDFAPRFGGLGCWKYLGRKQTYICVSHAVAGVMRRAGIPGESLHVIHSAVEPPLSLEEAQKSVLRTSLGLDCFEPLLGCIGQLVPHKNQRLAVEAFPQILARHPRAGMLLVGDGPEAIHLRQRAAELGILEHIRFVGQRSDATQLLQLMSLLMVPSREEGLNTTIQDAQWLKVPVVARAAGGIPELVQPDRGWLIQEESSRAFGAGVLEALDHAAERQQRSEEARRWIEAQGGVLGMAERIEQLYGQVLQRWA